MRVDQIQVASYSPVQRCWHIETLPEHIASNARCLGRGVLADTAYCAITIAESHEEAREAILKIKTLLSGGKEREDHE
jgi:hypothetical protein